jgi:hypothetical protein
MREADEVSVPALEETDEAAPLVAVASVPTLAALRATRCAAAVAAASLLRESASEARSRTTLRSSACLRAVAAERALSAAVLRCDWLRQPIEKTAALTRPPQMNASPIRSHGERDDLRRAGSAACGGGVRRSFRTGQRAWVVESDDTASASPPGGGLLPGGLALLSISWSPIATLSCRPSAG